ncbi:unnamed protein product [Symbiodinium sp. CCMP2592]|nr:unnamed protein product [Symbiodinium sp. CCMP2592]
MGHVSQCLRQDWSLAIRSRATSGRNEINPNGNTGYGSVFEAKWYMGFFGQLSCKRHIGYSNARTYPRRFGLLLADYWRTNQDSEDELEGPRMSTDVDMSKTDFELFLPLLRSTTVAEFAEADLLSCVKYLLRSKSIHFPGQWDTWAWGKLVRDGIKALKVHKAEEREKTKAKGNKSSSSEPQDTEEDEPKGVTIAPKARATKPKNKADKARKAEEPAEDSKQGGRGKSKKARKAEAVPEEEPSEDEEAKPRRAKAKARKPEAVPQEEPSEDEEPKPRRGAKAKARKPEAVPQEEPSEDEEPKPRRAKAKARKPEAVPEEEPSKDEDPKPRRAKAKARKAEAVPQEEPSEDEEPKPRRGAKAKARKAAAVPEEEPEDEEPKPRRAKAKARKAEAVPEEEPEDEEPKPRRGAKVKARKAEDEEEPKQPQSAKSAKKAKHNKGNPSPSKSIETPPKVRLSSKSKPTKRRKLAQDEDTVAADSDAERLAEVQAMLDEIDRVSEARSASKGKEEEDPFPETLVDPAPPKEQQQDEEEPQGDKEPEEDEPQGDKEPEEDEPQGDEEDDPQGDEELEEDEPQGLVAPPDHFELPVTVAVHPRGAVMEKNGLIQDIMADPSLKLDLLPSQTLASHILERANIVIRGLSPSAYFKIGHVLLSKQGKTGYRIDFTSPGMPSSSVKTRSRTFRNFSDRYEHEISNMLSRMDRLLQQKESAATTTKTAAPTTKTAATTVKPVPTPARASSMPAIVDKARAHQSGKFASCPNISQLMDGSLTDRNKALREWVCKGGNIDAMESSLEMHRQESLKVLNRLSGRSLGFGQEPSSSVYKGAGKKRGQFRCAAVKKEIGQLSNMIIDMSQADSPDLLKSLKAHDAKMKAFSLKLGMTKAGEKFDGLCEQIHEEASLPPALDPRLRVIARALLEEDFVESMYPSSADLHSYWAQLLLDFPDHWLKNKRKLWSYTIPIVLWGDEGTPDLSVFREHSKASRYMIYSLLASRYFVNGKTNETLQHLNAAVVKDINEETYYFVPVAFRGDLKYLTQCFNFVRNASSPQVCFKCLASRSDPGMLYTDINVDAPWTTTEYSHEPWVDRPAFAFIDGFDLQMVQVDWMHTWSLGVARDILGSAIKLMCRDTSIYGGPTIPKRLNELFKDLKIYAAATGKTVAMKRLRKSSLHWNRGCPELHCKAADASTFMSFVLKKLEESPLPGPYGGLLGMVWAADELSRCAMSSGVFLTMEQQRHLRVVGDVFLSSYCALATIACDRGEYYFKLRPKFHHLIHMLRDKRPSKRSPGWDNCYMDEDHIKHCVRILRKVSHRTAEQSLLKRNAVQAKQALLECLLPK